MSLQNLIQVRNELSAKKRMARKIIQDRHKKDWDDFNNEFNPKINAINSQISEASKSGVGKRIRSVMNRK